MYAMLIDTTTGSVKKVGRWSANRAIKKAARKARKAMRHYEGEAVLFGTINKDGASGREIRLNAPSIHSKKYITSVYDWNPHVEPLFVLRKVKR